MLGCEIIELADEGDEITWSEAYADRVLRDHGFSLAEYDADRGATRAKGARTGAAALLIWLGY